MRRVLVILLALIGLVSAGCGNNDKTPSDADLRGTTKLERAAQVCLDNHGGIAGPYTFDNNSTQTAVGVLCEDGTAVTLDD